MSDPKQALPFSRLGGLFSAGPAELKQLVFVTDKRDPLFEKHAEDPVDDQSVLNVAHARILQNIIVRVRKGAPTVILGHQRVKRVLVANALIGHAYDGPLKSVQEAIKRMTTESASMEVAKLAVAFLKGTALHVPVMVRNDGDEDNAVFLKHVENAFRRPPDPVEVQAAEAQRLASMHWSAQQIADSLKVSTATVNRWLKIDLNKPRVKQKRGKATRPPAALVKEFYEKVEETATKRERVLLAWILGAGSKSAVEEAFKL